MIDINPNSQEERLLEYELKRVTQCKNCGHWHEGLSPMDGICYAYHTYMTASDGCTKGKPRDESQNQ